MISFVILASTKTDIKKDVATGKSRLAKDTSSIHADLHCL